MYSKSIRPQIAKTTYRDSRSRASTPARCHARWTRAGRRSLRARRSSSRLTASCRSLARPSSNACTWRMGWMAHRKWKENKQQPGTAGPGNMPGCCLVSYHFLWAIRPIRPAMVIDLGSLTFRTSLISDIIFCNLQNLDQVRGREMRACRRQGVRDHASRRRHI